MARRISFILNSRSGNGQRDDIAKQIANLTKGIADVDILEAGEGEQLETLVDRAVAAHSDIVVAVGGDGTVSAVASKLAGTDIAMGVLPLGTLNHFAKDLNIPPELEKAIATVLHGNVAAVDVAEVSGRVFVNNSSLGLYPQIVLRRQALQRGGQGKWMAFLQASLAVFKRHSFMTVRLKADAKEMVRRTALVFVGNNLYTLSGLDAGTRESVTTGKLCLYVTRHQSRWSLALLAIKSLSGRLERGADLDALSTEGLIIDVQRPVVNVALDGEVVAMKPPLHYRARPGALRVLTPWPEAV